MAKPMGSLHTVGQSHAFMLIYTLAYKNNPGIFLAAEMKQYANIHTPRPLLIREVVYC